MKYIHEKLTESGNTNRAGRITDSRWSEKINVQIFFKEEKSIPIKVLIFLQQKLTKISVSKKCILKRRKNH